MKTMIIILLFFGFSYEGEAHPKTNCRTFMCHMSDADLDYLEDIGVLQKCRNHARSYWVTDTCKDIYRQCKSGSNGYHRAAKRGRPYKYVKRTIRGKSHAVCFKRKEDCHIGVFEKCVHLESFNYIKFHNHFWWE